MADLRYPIGPFMFEDAVTEAQRGDADTMTRGKRQRRPPTAAVQFLCHRLCNDRVSTRRIGTRRDGLKGEIHDRLLGCGPK